MNFDAAETSRTYTDRAVDASWMEWCRTQLHPIDKDVVDIGCGGGIYSFGFAAAGAKSVVGVDQSRQYIHEAAQAGNTSSTVSFRVGSASQTTLPDGCADIVFERALIHHLPEQQQHENAVEALRILRPSGLLCVQDRTFADVQASDADFWIRSTLFEAFPHLLDFERSRRPSTNGYADLLRQAGFAEVTVWPYREIRRRYASFEQLRDEILSRKGKSILFALSEAELRRYCELLEQKSASHPLIECDAWTVWLARP